MDDRERRQLEGMRTQLKLYEAGKLQLGGLISSLESLADELKEMPREWRDQFRRNWGVLEEVFAVAIDEGRTPTDDQDLTLLRSAAKALLALVDNALEEDAS